MVQVLNVTKPIHLLLALSFLVGMGALTFNLGLWQKGRAQEKQVLLAQQKMAESLPVLTFDKVIASSHLAEHRLLQVNGQWVKNSVVYIDNRQIQGKPAVQVIQGFKPTGYQLIIPVSRGYLARNPKTPRTAPNMPDQVQQSDGEVEIIVKILKSFPRSAELRRFFSSEQSKIIQEVSNGYAVWSNFELNEYQKMVQFEVTTFLGRIVTPQSDTKMSHQMGHTQNGYYQAPVKLSQQVAKHQGYAFQWFSLTAVLFLLGCFFVYREYFKAKK